MSGGQKQGQAGTDPGAAGSHKVKQDATQLQHADRRQQRDKTDEMEQHHTKVSTTVDRWLERQLNQLYSEVISEPLPKDMLELIDQLRRKTAPK